METLVRLEAKTKVQVQVFSDLEEISHKAAEVFINFSRSCIASQQKFSAAISGGSTPRRLYTLLSSDQYRNEVHWPFVHFFWTDERCVPKEHEESNFKTAFDALLSKIPIRDEKIHRIRGEEDPDKGARDYRTKSSLVVLAGDIGGTNSRFGLFRAELLDE
jgi:6-phosphogluconolactonase